MLLQIFCKIILYSEVISIGVRDPDDNSKEELISVIGLTLPTPMPISADDQFSCVLDVMRVFPDLSIEPSHRHLFPAPVDRTSTSAWLFKHPWITCQKIKLF